MSMRIASLLVAITLACASAAQAQANRYALLIGVGSYASAKITKLDGPPFDVAAVRAEITGRWGFPLANVRVLIDAQATRRNILDGLDWLIAVSRPGDEILIYFSGHGTSRQDRTQLQYGLHPGTGAVLPYDVTPTSEQAVLDSLIVGRRDLRPRLERLDVDRRVLVVLDSCYSRNATRSFARPRGTAKAAPLFGELEGFSATATVEPYPYQNVVSLTAASEAEQAIDISYEAIKDGVQTIDGRPKGSLTDALLRGLRGDANTDGNRTLTLDELFQFVRGHVASRFSHTPQLIVPNGRQDLTASPVFGASSAPVRRTDSVVHPLRVRIPSTLQGTSAHVSTLDGVSVATSGPYDVRLAESAGRWLLYDQSDDLLQEFPAGSRDQLMARLGRERYARQLVNFSIPGQDFNVRVNIPSPTGVLRSGRSYTISAAVDVPAALLLVNVDKDGTVSVLIPHTSGELQARTQWLIPDVRVSPPEGTEFLKVFAFRSPPDWLRSFVGAGSLPADSPRVINLVEQLRRAGPGVAEASLKVVTVR